MDHRLLEVLLVEDDDVDVMNVQRAFDRNRLTNKLHIASNGIDALALLRSGAVGARRIVLLDLNLPKMNGLEFLTAVRGDPALQSTVVVVLTTSNADRDKVESYRLNVAGYLLKPVTFAQFVELTGVLCAYWTLVEMP